MQLLTKGLLTVKFLILSCICLFGQSSIDRGKAFYESKKYQEAEKVFKAVARKASEYAAAQYSD